MGDTMRAHIEEDGTISIKTDKVSEVNHKSADEFMELLEDICGGGRETEKLKPKHVHVHQHKKVHAH
jgi:hypothetical protein